MEKNVKPVAASPDPHDLVALGKASIETKGGGANPQPDSNQPTRQAFGIQND